eukprot:Blabericola_migrator_1__1155@NODE_1299_length_4866_cov_77_666180_g874_i0_p1_GENE_NODE_1299_length_4866_cov_77_666180_g874_i0NODE_1299_length_4866_cov_77_666180_g874_i0_p1_ORF_typecomplete_len797_score86_61FUN14/PF04930_15/0_089_NODE_1299_length_4866_cov_77_666180_g874_i05722962
MSAKASLSLFQRKSQSAAKKPSKVWWCAAVAMEGLVPGGSRDRPASFTPRTSATSSVAGGLLRRVPPPPPPYPRRSLHNANSRAGPNSQDLPRELLPEPKSHHQYARNYTQHGPGESKEAATMSPVPSGQSHKGNSSVVRQSKPPLNKSKIPIKISVVAAVDSLVLQDNDPLCRLHVPRHLSLRILSANIIPLCLNVADRKQLESWQITPTLFRCLQFPLSTHQKDLVLRELQQSMLRDYVEQNIIQKLPQLTDLVPTEPEQRKLLCKGLLLYILSAFQMSTRVKRRCLRRVQDALKHIYDAWQWEASLVGVPSLAALAADAFPVLYWKPSVDAICRAKCDTADDFIRASALYLHNLRGLWGEDQFYGSTGIKAARIAILTHLTYLAVTQDFKSLQQGLRSNRIALEALYSPVQKLAVSDLDPPRLRMQAKAVYVGCVVIPALQALSESNFAEVKWKQVQKKVAVLSGYKYGMVDEWDRLFRIMAEETLDMIASRDGSASNDGEIFEKVMSSWQDVLQQCKTDEKKAKLEIIFADPADGEDENTVDVADTGPGGRGGISFVERNPIITTQKATPVKSTKPPARPPPPRIRKLGEGIARRILDLRSGKKDEKQMMTRPSKPRDSLVPVPELERDPFQEQDLFASRSVSRIGRSLTSSQPVLNARLAEAEVSYKTNSSSEALGVTDKSFNKVVFDLSTAAMKILQFKYNLKPEDLVDLPASPEGNPEACEIHVLHAISLVAFAGYDVKRSRDVLKPLINLRSRREETWAIQRHFSEVLNLRRLAWDAVRTMEAQGNLK